MESNLTVLIPTKELNTDYLIKSLESVLGNSKLPKEIIILHQTCENCAEDNTKLNKLIQDNNTNCVITLIKNTSANNYQDQINFGVSQVNTDYFTVLQDDDIFMVNYIRVIEQYTSKDVADLYLPININVDSNNEFLGLQNELIWANGFANTLGFIDRELLTEYDLFTINGFVMSKKAFKNIGGFKSSMTLSFDYEFLLRVAHKEMTIMVIPKVGNVHLVGREGGLLNKYEKTLTSEEFKFWKETAISESVYKKDRQVAYNGAK